MTTNGSKRSAQGSSQDRDGGRKTSRVRVNPWGVAGILAAVLACAISFVPYVSSGEPRGSFLGIIVSIAGVVVGSIGLSARSSERITPSLALVFNAIAFVVVAYFVFAYAIPTLILWSFQ
ncbi:hypothetical protein [Leifsonia aquatica]|uniref:hypothetical protein n=1 Tax=Leifsonia aquatica TaxID=144185 RepID=UPI0028B03E0A|nr:hypothetical protein [Leifsonia aquatica]